MKVKPAVLLILVLSGLGGWKYFSSQAATEDGQGELLIKALEATSAKFSVKAESRDWDQQGKLLSTVSYILDGDNWSMSLWDNRTEDVRECLSCWINVDGWLYIFDSRDGKYWKMAGNNEVSLNSRIDIRKTSGAAADKIRHRQLEVTYFGSEPCGGEVCRRYQIIDPEDSELSHYLWIGQGTGLVRREQFLLGNGQTSITDYGNYGSLGIELPEKVKNTTETADPFMLPGAIRFPKVLNVSPE